MTTQEQRARFDEWMQAHGAIVHRTARAFAASPADRADITQELMLAIWRAIPAFRAEARVSTFLYRVTHNAAMTWRRAQGNRDRLSSTEALEIEALATSEPIPDQLAAEAEQLTRMYAAIHGLRPLDRSLLLLALDGLSYREIAEIHGLSISNVGVRLNRIRRRLSEQLEERERCSSKT